MEKKTERMITLRSIADVKEFTTLANAVNFDMDIISGRYRVDAKSIMGVFSLDLTKSLRLELHASEKDCQDFLDDVSKFITE